MVRRGGMRNLATWCTGLAAVVLAWSAVPADAKINCDKTSKCTNQSVVAQVRVAVDASCDCTAAAKKKDYKKCWGPIVRGFQKELGKTGFPGPCRREVKRALLDSLCGRPEFVICRNVTKKGEEVCSAKKATKCQDSFPPSSVCGALLSCADACNPEGCTPETTTTSTTIETTTTTLEPETTTTTLAPETTTTTLAPETTTTTLAPETTTTTVDTTTTTSSTTSTTVPIEAVLNFITGAAGGFCGEARTGGEEGTILKNLLCGGLNIGGGDSTVPEGPTPANALTQFNVECLGDTCTVSARTSAETGSSTNCSAVGCSFGPFLSIANGGLSTCVSNTFLMDGSGTLDLATGAFDGGVPLQSEVTVTGNDANPCPSCVDGEGGPVTGAGVCDATADNPGAACVGINAAGDTYDCNPSGDLLTPFGVDLTPIGTGVASKTGPTFCPGQSETPPGKNGCFAFEACDYIEERGTAAAGITVGGGPTAATLASVFCIPATGNGLIDGAADLPGPGATSLPGTLELLEP